MMRLKFGIFEAKRVIWHNTFGRTLVPRWLWHGGLVDRILQARRKVCSKRSDCTRVLGGLVPFIIFEMGWRSDGDDGHFCAFDDARDKSDVRVNEI